MNRRCRQDHAAIFEPRRRRAARRALERWSVMRRESRARQQPRRRGSVTGQRPFRSRPWKDLLARTTLLGLASLSEAGNKGKANVLLTEVALRTEDARPKTHGSLGGPSPRRSEVGYSAPGLVPGQEHAALPHWSWATWPVSLTALVQRHVKEKQRRRGRVAIVAADPGRHKRQRAGRANSDDGVLAPEKVIAVAAGQLSDVEHLPGAAVRLQEQLVLLDAFGSREERVPITALEGSFRRVGVQRVSRPIVVLPPGQRRL